MMCAIFFAVYFRQAWGRGSIRWMTFFISLYVVFLFALLGEWSPAIFLARIYDTLLGVAAALLATYVVPSPGSRARLHQEAEALWNDCRSELWTAATVFTDPDGRLAEQHGAYLLRLDNLRTHSEDSLYETFLSPQARRLARERFATAEMLCYLSLGLFDSMACGRHSPGRLRLRTALREKLGPVSSAAFDDFEPPSGPHKSEGPTPTRLEACTFATKQFGSSGLEDSERVWAMPVLYYAAALFTALKPDTRARHAVADDDASARSGLLR
jgi:hypothetical protein